VGLTNNEGVNLMPTLYAARQVPKARYEALLREAMDEYNASLPLPHNHKLTLTFFDAMLSRSRKASRVRYKVFVKLRELNFSFPAIGRISGYDHSTIIHGTRVAAWEQKGKRYRPLNKQNAPRIRTAQQPDHTNTSYTPRNLSAHNDDVLQDVPHHTPA